MAAVEAAARALLLALALLAAAAAQPATLAPGVSLQLALGANESVAVAAALAAGRWCVRLEACWPTSGLRLALSGASADAALAALASATGGCDALSGLTLPAGAASPAAWNCTGDAASCRGLGPLAAAAPPWRGACVAAASGQGGQLDVNGIVFLAAASSLGPALFALRADPPDANNSCEAAAVAAASACAPLPPPPAAFEVAGNLTLDAAGNASAFPLGAVWPALQGVTATATSEWARVDAVASDESRTRATLALVLGAASYDALSRMAARLRAATSVAGLAVVSLSMQLPPPPPPVDPLPPDSRPRITVALPIGMGVLIALAGGLLAARWLREQRRLAREEAAEGFMLHRRQDEADL